MNVLDLVIEHTVPIGVNVIKGEEDTVLEDIDEDGVGLEDATETIPVVPLLGDEMMMSYEAIIALCE